jgi:hypothetical protein
MSKRAEYPYLEATFLLLKPQACGLPHVAAAHLLPILGSGPRVSWCGCRARSRFSLSPRSRFAAAGASILFNHSQYFRRPDIVFEASLQNQGMSLRHGVLAGDFGAGLRRHQSLSAMFSFEEYMSGPQHYR